MIGDGQMPDHSGASGNFTITTDDSATGNTDAGGNSRMGTDTHVMRHLDLIIEFTALLDNRIVQGPAIDRGVGTNFHIICDNNSAKLRNLVPSVPVHHQPEAVGTDDHTGVQYAAIPDLHRARQGNPAMQMTMASKCCTALDDTARADDTTRTDCNAIFDNSSGADAHSGSETGTGCNLCGWVDSSGSRRCSKPKRRHCLDETVMRIIRYQQVPGIDFCGQSRRHDDDTATTVENFHQIFFAQSKTQIAGSGR